MTDFQRMAVILVSVLSALWRVAALIKLQPVDFKGPFSSVTVRVVAIRLNFTWKPGDSRKPNYSAAFCAVICALLKGRLEEVDLGEKQQVKGSFSLL